MPHQQAPLSYTVFVYPQVTDLGMHLFQGAHCHLSIIRRTAVPICPFLVPELKIGHIDIDDPSQEPQRLYPLITATVIDYGYPKTVLHGHQKGLQYLRYGMGRGNQVYVMTTPVLQLYHLCRQIPWFQFYSLAQMAYLVVLTERATEIAKTEEDGP